MDDIRHYIDNRWVSKTHALSSDLQRGQFHEFDTRLLHCMFDSLVEFVEIEQAWMNAICDKDSCAKYYKPWYRRGFFLRKWRSPECGLDHLHWAASQKNDDPYVIKGDPNYGSPTCQALAAQETIELYKWWKDVRPKRPDPMDASGLTAFYNTQRKEPDDSLLFFEGDRTEAETEQWHKLSEFCQKIEDEQEEEDTHMMVRLIKLRRHLWT